MLETCSVASGWSLQQSRGLKSMREGQEDPVKTTEAVSSISCRPAKTVGGWTGSEWAKFHSFKQTQGMLSAGASSRSQLLYPFAKCLTMRSTSNEWSLETAPSSNDKSLTLGHRGSLSRPPLVRSLCCLSAPHADIPHRPHRGPCQVLWPHRPELG